MLGRDSLKLGMLLGFLAPILGVVIFYFWKASANPFGVFLETALQNRQFLTMLISFSLFVNAAVFTIYINKRKDKTARGVFISTCIYAIGTLLIKMFAL
ncbi:MAG TPA: hypothetical protein VF622_11030 [Segetibacter sp.]|jgi:hypothetical protein